MNWQQETRAWALASAGVFALSAIGIRVMSAPPLPDLAPVVANLNRGATAWANASAQQVSSIAAIERDIRADTWHVDRLVQQGSQTLSEAQRAIGTLNGSLSHVAPLLDSLRASSDALPPVIRHIGEDADILTDSASAITVNANGGVTDFRRFITAPALADTVNNAASITGSAAGIMADGRKLADHYTEQDLKPAPWWKKPFVKGGQIIDIGAAVARHLP